MKLGGGDMTSIVQRIARQAVVTYRRPAQIGDRFLENNNKLKSLMTEVRAADLKLVPPRTTDVSAPLQYHHRPPPVTYMHICETDQFSMGVFLLKTGASIPLHDHPGMFGMLKVVYGKIRISCFDHLERPSGGLQAIPQPSPVQTGALRRSVIRSAGEYTEESGPCVLFPERDNLHQIDAVDGPTAFLDILAPPYDPGEGRDCHYYKLLTEEEQNRVQDEKEVWLLEISQPKEFWCEGEPYPGPEVCL